MFVAIALAAAASDWTRVPGYPTSGTEVPFFRTDYFFSQANTSHPSGMPYSTSLNVYVVQRVTGEAGYDNLPWDGNFAPLTNAYNTVPFIAAGTVDYNKVVFEWNSAPIETGQDLLSSIQNSVVVLQSRFRRWQTGFAPDKKQVSAR
jgi:hypothetical protein